MTGVADLVGRDLLSLRAERRQAQHVAILQDRFRRDAESIGVDPACRETSRLIAVAEADAATSADRERLIALAIRFAADEQSGRPAPTPAVADAHTPSAQGLLARAFAALTSSRNGGAG